MSDTTPAQQPENGAQPDNAALFSLEKVYIKDFSVENPNAPDSFLEQAPPQIEVQLMNQAKNVAEGIFESVLTATVTARLGDKVIFLVEVAQAGVFQVRNIPEEIMNPLIGIQCPTILFPYLREAVSDAIQRAGYTPVYLSPINFEAWYAEQQQREQTQGEDTLEA